MALRFHEWIEYTKRMNSHVKFKFDHEAIRDEYLEHMEDMYEFYVGRGMDPDLAKSTVLEDMGDPDELGRVLNQIHNPVLGWIWRLSRWLMLMNAWWMRLKWRWRRWSRCNRPGRSRNRWAN